MAEEKVELSDEQRKEISTGEIQYISKDLRNVLNDDQLYEAFPLYNKSHLICIPMPCNSGDVLVTSYGEIDDNQYLDPRTAQVAIVDHFKQVCTEVRPATDEELPSHYIEELRYAFSDFHGVKSYFSFT